MATEVEAKFLAADATVLAGLATASTLSDARLGPAATVDEIDIYLDTADGRLRSAGWACRLRDRGSGFIVSLKGPAPAAGGADAWLHSRPEIEGPASSSMRPVDWPASEAREMLARLSHGETLGEQFRLRQLRTERGVHLGAERLGTLSLDVVTVIGSGGEPLGVLDVVELELMLSSADDPAARGQLDRLAAALADWPGLVADPRTKLEHAQELLAR